MTTQLFGRILRPKTLVFSLGQESQSFRAYPFYSRQCQRVISRSHPGTEGTDIMGIFSNRWAGYDLNDTLTNLIIKPLISMMRTILCGFIQIHELFEHRATSMTMQEKDTTSRIQSAGFKLSNHKLVDEHRIAVSMDAIPSTQRLLILSRLKNPIFGFSIQSFIRFDNRQHISMTMEFSPFWQRPISSIITLTPALRLLEYLWTSS